MSFDFFKTDEKLLDIGKRTGFASIPFSMIGLKVYGLDASQEMLNICKSKSPDTFSDTFETIWDDFPRLGTRNEEKGVSQI